MLLKPLQKADAEDVATDDLAVVCAVVERRNKK